VKVNDRDVALRMNDEGQNYLVSNSKAARMASQALNNNDEILLRPIDDRVFPAETAVADRLSTTK